MSINFPSNPSNNQIYVADNGTNWIFSNTKNVWSVVSQSTYQVAVTTANTWTNPNTGNTFGMYQTSGSKYIVTNPVQNASHNTVSIGTQFLGYNASSDTVNVRLKIPRSIDANTDYILEHVANNDYIFTTFNRTIVVEGVSYNSFDGWETDALFYNFDLPIENVPNDSEIIIESGNTINLAVTYRLQQVWFDPEELGFTDFRAAKLDYRAYLDGQNGFTEINTIHYSKPNRSITNGYKSRLLDIYTDSEYKLPIRTTSNNETTIYQNSYFLDTYDAEHGNKLYYLNYTDPVDFPPGNLFIQWAGTVWTGPAN